MPEVEKLRTALVSVTRFGPHANIHGFAGPSMRVEVRGGYVSFGAFNEYISDALALLTEQDAELARLRRSELDNHHNAAGCPYCRPKLEAEQAELATLRAENALFRENTRRLYAGILSGGGTAAIAYACPGSCYRCQGDVLNRLGADRPCLYHEAKAAQETL